MVPGHVLAAVFAFEVLQAKVDDAIVKIFAAEVRVTGSRLNFENPILDCQDRHIEGASAHVVNENVLLTASLLVQPIRNRSCRRLINDTQHIHARDGTSVFRRLALGVIEICWNCHHSIVHFPAQVCFRCLFHFQEDHGRNFFGVVFLLLALAVYNNHGLVTLSGYDFERPELDV
mmetsp:Transcript_121575/g.344507  ORF Transcript_121575/g.344507 Transcript_121575/m.344507 type:complete len:175 (-) Transcript_121575:329-853(-)